MGRILAVSRQVERIATWGGCISLMLLMLIVTADVGFRYFLNQPFSWSHDVITLYITPALFFLTLSDAHRVGAQVNVDVLQRALPVPVRRITDALCNLAAIVVFALIAYGGARRALDAWENGDAIAGHIAWLTWPSAALVPIGAGMLVLRLASSLVANLVGSDEAYARSHEDLHAEGAFE
ncbi:TRAP transporter small permease (plasmid) [Azospirillum oryzae]|uniref:TRAP transporter small permease protein n=1 Tax=Azospirillum oryzae TaxID=286727 RepID=A0A6N1B329_9PROT|nr:TRAP transporter small permease [Azospirillum oryzae]KAA0587836.1 TRAP transporter small permease [Azospirillum oryzae]QKS53952.1 TRAP transporter small permease [Azospirillum oryzae]GLR77751.1 hypothetical protein GCM10007856_04190 [Azospirillum oryzae]